MRIVVTGGAGFVGSHLVDRLMARGDDVIVIDNFFTGRKDNLAHHLGNPRFELIRHDVVEPILLEVDHIYHLACPASPIHYKFNPVKTIKTNVMGTLNMLGLAKRIGARFLLTSTSEVYGDPLEHPQKETYWGHVNPIGVRSCYDEGKRTAETLTMDYHRGADVEQRGKMKEEEFVKKLQEMMMEEEKQRIPIAQGLPWTTDEPECLKKPPIKEITQPIDLKLHSDVRAVERAEFDHQVFEKLTMIEQYKMEREMQQKLEEEEEIRRLRRELVPKAQPMPYFDRPFVPSRSSKQPTIPKEPRFQFPQQKKIKCSLSWSDLNDYIHAS